MAGPVIAATATRVAAFSPLLFWPGIVGEFMKYLPITLIATLSASLAVALFFTPTLGALARQGFAPSRTTSARARTALYMRTVQLALRHPARRSRSPRCCSWRCRSLRQFGSGVEFFPDVEPDFGQVIVHARGNLSLDEKNRFLAEVEKRVLDMPRRSRPSIPASASSRAARSEISEDTIGVIQFEFADWQTRPPAHEIMDDIRAATADIPGILVEVTAPRAGPPTGKPIQVQLGALDPELLPAAAKKVAAMLASRSDIHDLDDGLPLPGIDWKLHVDKAEAAKFGANPATVGTALQLVTNGVKVYRIPPGRHRQVGRHPGALPRGPPQPRPDRRVARADPVRLRADRQFRQAHGRAARRLHQPRRRQPRHDGLGQRGAGRAVGQGAGGDRQGACDRPILARASPGG